MWTLSSDWLPTLRICNKNYIRQQVLPERCDMLPQKLSEDLLANIEHSLNEILQFMDINVFCDFLLSIFFFITIINKFNNLIMCNV